MGFLADILTGGSASSMAALFTNPLEVVKTRLQVQGEMVASNAAAKRYSGLLDALVKIPREEGLRAIQKGLGPGMLYQFAMNGARLGTYPTLKRALDADGGHSRAGTALRHTAAGGVAGALGAVAGSPLFMVKCRLQAQSSLALAQADSGAAGMGHQHKYAGAIDGLRTVWREEGLRGMFRGVDGAVPRVMVGSAAQLASYESAKQAMRETGLLADGLALHFGASMLSGLVVTTCMNPFDVVSTRLYNQPQGAARRYSGPLDCFAKTFRAEGVAGLYKGWTAHYARLGPHTVLSLVFWEQTKLLHARLAAAP